MAAWISTTQSTGDDGSRATSPHDQRPGETISAGGASPWPGSAATQSTGDDGSGAAISAGRLHDQQRPGDAAAWR